MFNYLQSRIRGTASTGPGEPPPGLMAFYWHFARQTKGWYAAMFATSLGVALIDTVIPVFIGSLVSLMEAADRHAALAPSPAAPERAAFLKWFFFAVSHVHPVLLQIFYPERYAGSPEAEAAFTQGAVARIKTALALLYRRATEENPQWFSPAQPSILGYYVSTLARWLKMFKPGDPRHIDFSAYPGLAAIAAALEARPAALAAARAEGLGATIFTVPVYD